MDWPLCFRTRVEYSCVFPLQLSLYGLTRTRRAVATLMAAGDAEAAADRHEQGNSAASIRPTAFTPPEMLRPSEPEGEGGAVPGKLGAADAYAFGMIAWEVCYSCTTLPRSDLGGTSRICSGGRPRLWLPADISKFFL